ncbi:DUF2283 domain-containing protein [Candidatus Amoebophilus asiaticus]|nr:DUF2283 domain-containing protein [Candidatus Amoebophilus asiaticus]
MKITEKHTLDPTFHYNNLNDESSYDEEEEVLNINFNELSHADYSESIAEGVYAKYEHGELVGITIYDHDVDRND